MSDSLASKRTLFLIAFCLASCSGSVGGGSSSTSTPTNLNVVSTLPQAGAIDVPSPQIITATFDSTLDASLLEPGWMTAASNGSVLPGTLQVNPGDHRTLFLTLSLPPGAQQTVAVALSSAVTSESGKTLAQGYSWTFVTASSASGTLALTRLPDFQRGGDYEFRSILNAGSGKIAVTWDEVNSSVSENVFMDETSGAGAIASAMREFQFGNGQVLRDGAGGVVAIGHSTFIGFDPSGGSVVRFLPAESTGGGLDLPGAPRLVVGLVLPGMPATMDYDAGQLSWDVFESLNPATLEFGASNPIVPHASGLQRLEVRQLPGNDVDIIARAYDRHLIEVGVHEFGLESLRGSVVASTVAPDGSAALVIARAIATGSRLTIYEYTNAQGWSTGETVTELPFSVFDIITGLPVLRLSPDGAGILAIGGLATPIAHVRVIWREAASSQWSTTTMEQPSLIQSVAVSPQGGYLVLGTGAIGEAWFKGKLPQANDWTDALNGEELGYMDAQDFGLDARLVPTDGASFAIAGTLFTSFLFGQSDHLVRAGFIHVQ